MNEWKKKVNKGGWIVDDPRFTKYRCRFRAPFHFSKQTAQEPESTGFPGCQPYPAIAFIDETGPIYATNRAFFYPLIEAPVTALPPTQPLPIVVSLLWLKKPFQQSP